MGSWGFGSAESDNALDGYPSEYYSNPNKSGESVFFPPHVRKLEYFLDQIQDQANEDGAAYKLEQYVGVILLALKDKVIPSKKHLKQAQNFILQLLELPHYCEQYSEPKKRRAALLKEYNTFEKLISGNILSAKSILGLVEPIVKKSKFREDAGISVIVRGQATARSPMRKVKKKVASEHPKKKRAVKVRPAAKNLLRATKHKTKEKAATPKRSPTTRNARPSPSESATLFAVGVKKKGGNGKIWMVVENKNGVKRWAKT